MKTRRKGSIAAAVAVAILSASAALAAGDGFPNADSAFGLKGTVSADTSQGGGDAYCGAYHDSFKVIGGDGQGGGYYDPLRIIGSPDEGEQRSREAPLEPQERIACDDRATAHDKDKPL